MSTPPELLYRLRQQTAEAHAKLENSLDLLRHPPIRERFRQVLAGFYGFHAVWEPAARARLPALLEVRGRMRLLETDLRTLGFSNADVASLPRCDAAADLARTRERALGSLYVMEGSTLGGVVIAKAIEGADWTGTGLNYFSPYGKLTAARWRETQAALTAEAGDAEDQVIEGAIATFELLQSWLAPVETAAA